MENYAETGCLQELLDRPSSASKTRFLQYLGCNASFGRSRTATLASKSAPTRDEN
ncbi:MAG: hypothetical protein ACMG55_03505 [Microcoleus sp.]